MIEHLRHIRRDGKVISGLDAQAIIDLGWVPDKVVRLEWDGAGRRMHRDCPDGVLAQVLPGRRLLALLEHAGAEAKSPTRLCVVNEDGSLRYALSNFPVVHGRRLHGAFAWFERARVEPERCFGVIFQTVPDADGGLGQFQLDFDSATGEMVGATESR